MKFKTLLFILTISTVLLVSGCVDNASLAISGNYKIEFTGTEISTNSKTAIIDGSVITIISQGNYTISGTLTDGQIIVNAPKEDVNLILNNVEITCTNNSPIYIVAGGDVYITVSEGTTNSIIDGTSYEYDNESETEQNAAIFSKDDLTILGNGLLSIKANFRNGLSSNDSLTIDGCNIVIDAKHNGIRGKDFLVIKNSNINVKSGNDGIKSTNETDPGSGYIILTDNIITISSVDEAISGINKVTLSGNTIDIDTRNNGIKSLTTIDIQSGTLTMKTLDDDFIAETITGSDAADVTVNGSKYIFN